MRELRKPNFVRHKKLVRTMTFSAVLLVAATLLLSGSVTALDLQVNSTPMKKEINKQTVWLSSATDNIQGVEKDPITTQGSPAFTDYIHFDDGTNTNSLGLTAGGTFEYAIRITPTELSGYDGWELSSVRHHHAWSGGAGPSVSGNIKIYDEGTATSPGTLLYSQAYTTLAVPGWEEYELDTPVVIDETKDIWVCLEVTHLAGEYPAGMDPGPAVDGKGDWIALSGAWQEIQDLGFDCNWNIWAGLEEGGPGPDHDVGVTSIVAPESGPAGVITPEVKVKNYGSNPETAVPVNMEIKAYGSPVSYFSDGFEGWTVGYYDFPTGWTIQTTNPTGTWYMYSSSTSYSASTYPRCQESGSDGNAQDESLISPVIDCTALSNVALRLPLFYFYAYASDYATLTISGSNDGGSSWNTIASYTATTTGAKDFDITSWAAGQNVQFKFNFESAADTSLNSYCYFDNMWVGDPTLGAWGTYGDNPPLGWTIERLDTTAWDYNHWYKYTSSSYDMYGSCARIYYTSPAPELDDSLISPSIDCSALSTVILQYNTYFYSYTTYDNHGFVEVSTDGGTTWQQVDDYYRVAPGSYGYCIWYEYYNGYDITTLAAGHSDVKVRFRMTRPALATYGYWYLDNVRISDGSGTFKFIETFDAGSSSWGGSGACTYFTVFKNYIHDDWGGKWDWKPIREPYYNNKWLTVTSCSDPVCTPYEGSLMAQYYSNIYQGMQAMLYSIPIDVSAAGTLKMSFFMYHDTQSGLGSVDILASHDGLTWENMGTFYRNDGTTGWSIHIVDLTGYEDDTALQIALLGTSDYVAYMNFDLVDIFDPNLITEYSETVYVNLAVGETKDVTLPTWTPDAWQVQENVNIIYEVYASTDLATDVNPDNDLKASTIVLSYPYLHDIAVLSIDNPTSGVAQTLPVEVTIKNIGQFPECCYQTDVGIGQFVYDITGFFSNFDSDNGGFTVSAGVWEWGTPTYGPTSAYSGAKVWATVLGGTYPTYADSSLISSSITVPTDGDLIFWHWWDTEESYDGGNVKISTDGGSSWTLIYPESGYTGTANSANPLYPEPIFSGHEQGYWEQMTFDLASYEGMPVMFSFDFGSDGSVQYPGWYIDDVLVGEVEVSLEPEYSDLVCTIELDPGEEAQLVFDDWTPAALALGISGDREYGIIAEQLLSTDTNPENDVMIESIVLQYWHDVKVKSITQPSSLGRDPWDLLFSFNLETATGALGNAGAEFDGTYFYSTRWATNLIHQFDNTGTLVKEFSIAGVSGLRDLAYNEDTGYFYGGAAAGTIWVMDFDSETLISTLSGSFQSRAIGYNSDDDVIYCSNWADPVWVVDPATGTIISQFNLGTATSTYGFAYDNNPDTGKMLYVFDQGSGAGYPQYIYEWDLDGGVMTGFTYDVASDFPASSGIAGGLFVNSGFVPGKLIIGGCLQGTPDMMFAYELRTGGTGGGGYPPITVWVAPGNQQVEAIVGNEGTFEETGLTCYGTLYQYIDDPENGTLVWDDSIANIDLDPLGDEETVPFGSVNFNMQGPWGLYIELPLATDDVENNNLKSLGIGVDDTNPTSSHTLSPASPDGLNGWYISDVTVTLDAEDGTQDWQSGVDVIKYKVGSGAVQTINGDHGTFKIENDGEDIPVEYWAIDNVGNEETPHHTFTIDMDQTKPQITLEYEVTGGGPLEGWEFTFTATATDETSGMERVEFYFNGVLQETVTGSGPTYVWVIEYIPVPQAYFKAVGYDMAGLNDFYQIENPDPRPHSNQQNVQPMTTIKINLGR